MFPAALVKAPNKLAFLEKQPNSFTEACLTFFCLSIKKNRINLVYKGNQA
jgi:hypothetical protein